MKHLKEPYYYFPSRPKYRAAWIGVQVVALIPWMLATMVTVEMVFAEPGKGYVAPSGQHVSCEALAPRGKSGSMPKCALFGSKETNPGGFALAVASFALLSGIMWISSRPGRGLKFSK
jgi:hypothetical protein